MYKSEQRFRIRIIVKINSEAMLFIVFIFNFFFGILLHSNYYKREYLFYQTTKCQVQTYKNNSNRKNKSLNVDEGKDKTIEKKNKRQFSGENVKVIKG